MADRPGGIATGRGRGAAPCQDEAGIAPLQTLQRWLSSSAESRLRGRALRRRTPRNRLEIWRAAKDRPDPVALVEAVNATRDPDLVPLRNARMAASPLAFFRGTANIMAADLATTPVTGLCHPICHDAHAGNFGLYTSPEWDLVFDLNDFDETRPGPSEWDVKRLAASLVLAARESGHDRAAQEEAAQTAARAYRRGLAESADLHLIDRYFDVAGARRILERVAGADAQRAVLTLLKGTRRTVLGTPPLLRRGVRSGTGAGTRAVWRSVRGERLPRDLRPVRARRLPRVGFPSHQVRSAGAECRAPGRHTHGYVVREFDARAKASASRSILWIHSFLQAV